MFVLVQAVRCGMATQIVGTNQEKGQKGPRRHLGFGMPGACDWTEGPGDGNVLKDVIGGGTKGAVWLDQ